MGKGYDLATAEERDVARERAAVQIAPPRQQGAPQQEEDQLPEWWNPTPALHVSLYYKEEVRFSSSLCTVLNLLGIAWQQQTWRSPGVAHTIRWQLFSGLKASLMHH